jgi:two-component system nitrogen regulation response regulator GlnG
MNAVWIVDDDRSIRWVLEKPWRGRRFHTRASARRPRCWRRWTGLPAAPVLVSDIRMPGESGLSLLSKIKARFRTCRSSS